MRLVRGPSLIACALLAGACSQADQTLPFDTVGAEVTRSIPAAGGTVSTSQGASVFFPAGALPQGTPVTLLVIPQPAFLSSGKPVGTASFQLAPAGTALARPAQVSLKLASTMEDAWLTSVVNVTDTGVQEIGAGDADLSSGLVRTGIAVLGTLSAVVPEPAAVIRAAVFGAVPEMVASSTGAGSGPVVTRRISRDCGASGQRCALGVEASRSLLDLVRDVALVYPQVQGSISIEGARASGAVTLSGALKTRLGKSSSGEQTSLTVEATPSTLVSETATELVLDGVLIRGTGAGMGGDETATLRIRHDGAATGPLEVTRSDIRAGDQAHSFRVVIPVARFWGNYDDPHNHGGTLRPAAGRSGGGATADIRACVRDRRRFLRCYARAGRALREPRTPGPP